MREFSFISCPAPSKSNTRWDPRVLKIVFWTTAA
ncbi:hypothetical protein NC653_020717 [Populus alba x Populus x berolinensis]|uniref:Uncharacterized protein n=1 Tax=Populus alba x Populus x berolinensis TaxID=444605 RepID=A0AAD6ML42_9ROSI|nr:hypothetical protein NC653_020717 [Populus alba x Populus x berolinensis]